MRSWRPPGIRRGSSVREGARGEWPAQPGRCRNRRNERHARRQCWSDACALRERRAPWRGRQAWHQASLNHRKARTSGKGSHQRDPIPSLVPKALVEPPRPAVRSSMSGHGIWSRTCIGALRILSSPPATSMRHWRFGSGQTRQSARPPRSSGKARRSISNELGISRRATSKMLVGELGELCIGQ